MRPALILAALAALAACGDKTGPTGPERRSAAGEVLGGEVTDEMLPLDIVRSTSPADRSPDSGATPAAGPSNQGATPEAPAPRPVLSEAPMPDMTMPADPEPLRTPGA